MPVRLLRDIIIAGNVLMAYETLEKSESWATWADDNPELVNVLEQARMEYER